jgi:hypothetical protein
MVSSTSSKDLNLFCISNVTILKNRITAFKQRRTILQLSYNNWIKVCRHTMKIMIDESIFCTSPEG